MYKGLCPQVSGRSPPCHLILNRLTMFPEPPLDARDYHTEIDCVPVLMEIPVWKAMKRQFYGHSMVRAHMRGCRGLMRSEQHT